MYTKQEISKQKQAFWTAFGRYLKPILSADGEEINWINYKTGNKAIHFKMDVDSKTATIAIVLSHPDPAIRQEYFNRLKQMEGILAETLEETDWTWLPSTTDEQEKPISTIAKQLPNVNIFRNEDWPAIISFLKPRIIALDAFWSMARYQFQDLQ
jgi:hypothetical protein